MPAMSDPTPDRAAGLMSGTRFSERDFYLAEFRDRTLAFALSALDESGAERVESVLQILERNRTRVLLLGSDPGLLRRLAARESIELDDAAWVGRVWRATSGGYRTALSVAPGGSLPRAAARVALRLRLAKLVLLDARGGLADPNGRRIGSVDLPSLDDLAPKLGSGDRALLEEIRGLLVAGFPSVTVCSAQGLEDELFTWSGSGTFFTRERYASVRHLGLDEFAAAEELVRRGVEEGYLLPRSPEELEALLANAYGVFVEGRFLAGIGALIPYPDEAAAEIASLYTLTRFVGEGVGAHLVRFARERATADGLQFVFACTTSDRVAGFFERHGFRAVGPGSVPRAKWDRYDPARRASVRCFRLDVAPAPDVAG
jgi:N-acetylglutamate synthase-like GNAT family acetyltransferase